MDGDGYSLIVGVPTVFRPPGYPVFVAGIYALVGATANAVLAAQVVVGSLAMWLVYLAARRTVDERAAFAGALLAGAYPQMAFYAATLLSETLALLFIATAILAATYVLNGRRPLLAAAICGTALSLAGLTSPRLAALPLAVLIAFALCRMPLRRLLVTTAALTFGYAMILAPWVARNELVFGRPIPLTVGQSGLNLWLLAHRVSPDDYRLADLAKSEPLIGRWVELYEGHGKPQEHERFDERLALEEELTRDAIVRIASDPLGYVAYRLRQLPGLWIQPAAYAGNFRPPFDSQNVQLQSMIEQRNWGAALLRAISIVVFTVGLFAGLALGIWRWRRRVHHIAVLLAPAFYMLVLHLALFADFPPQRYSVLSHPFMWVVAASGIGYAFSGGAGLVRTKLRRAANR